ncbi:Acetate kinase [compost metagenome]
MSARKVIANGNRMAINVGSSSIKTSMFFQGSRVDININFIGLASQTVKVKFNKLHGRTDETYTAAVGDDLAQAAALILDKAREVLAEIEWPEPTTIGHRVKFAGFGPPVERIRKESELILEFNDYLSSRHNSLCLEVIRKSKALFASSMQLMVRDQAVNDLSLHREDLVPFEKSLIRRYGLYANGYHGLAIKACLRDLRDRYGATNFTGVICQVGSGVSFSSILDGRVVYNSMQFAACDGPVMHNRSGTQPLGLTLRLLKYGLNPSALSNTYNRVSGIYGLAGLSPNSSVTVEDILSQKTYEGAKAAYLTANAIELFKAISECPESSNFVFSGGLATKHRWIGPELLYRARRITQNTKNNLIQQLKDPGLFVASEPGVNVYLVDIDEQACILDECDHFPEENNYVDFSSAICEVPGTSIGVVSEGRAGWGEGKVCLVFTNSEFSFDREDLPEAFIFYGTHRDDFFLRAAFSRVFKVPAIFIDEGAIDMSVFLNRKIYIDTPTNVVVKL